MERRHCIVPFCRRTTGEPWREWICPVHWRAVPRGMRLLHFKWRRLAVKAVMRGRDLPRIEARANAAWEVCKGAAVEAAAGVR